MSKSIEEEDKLELLMDETSSSLSLTSIMAMVSFFFIGLLLQTREGSLATLKMPLLYLFVSAFAFLYSTLIYANASGNIARLKDELAEKHLIAGNIISEFLGVYLIVFSMPMIISNYIDSLYFSATVFGFGVTGFWLYHQLGYSILQRYVKNAKLFYLLLFFVVTIYASNFFTYIFSVDLFLIVTSVIIFFTVVILVGYAIYCRDEKIDYLHK
ncbi:hypothetical protein KGY79_10425 [Candidatus Bipolaricaulota bacterium]|nr:hypothetical protein [Candidatus Bipolaricaulota bacterium]